MKAYLIIQLVFIIFSIITSSPVRAEKEVLNGITYKSGGYYDELYIFHPNSYLFFDLGKDKEKKIDLYSEGIATFNIQMIGIDILHRLYGSHFEKGVSFGLGISIKGKEDKTNNSYNDDPGNFLMCNIGIVFQFKKAIRVESGFILGISAKEDLESITDSAIYFGLSFPTKLTNLFK